MNNIDKAEAAYHELELLLLKTGYDIAGFKPIEYGLQFIVSRGRLEGTLRIYQNKKGVVKYDYSLIKNQALMSDLRQLANLAIPSSSLDKFAREDAVPPFPYIGTDESGKGDYFGPLVSAGVYVNERTSLELLSCGVRDSKKLGDKENQELARKIAMITRGKLAIIEIPPEKYNALYHQFKSENKSLNTLLAWGHAKALEEVLSKVECKIAIADQFADERVIIAKLQERGRLLRLIQRHKAEDNVGVAAASIVARARFLEKLERLSKEYGIPLPKGASDEVVVAARKFVATHGKESLSKVAKLHFKTTLEVFR